MLGITTDKEPIVKICGNRFPEDALFVASCRPHMMGWIFSPFSPRRVSWLEASRMIESIRRTDQSIKHVAVFAGNDFTDMLYIIRKINFDYIQVVENAQTINNLRKVIGQSLSIIPVIRVNQQLDENRFLQTGPADLYILDSYVKDRPGGTGKRIVLDWVKGMRFPFLLAGGLNPDNVRNALLESGAIGVDVSSGVENEPGRKNQQKVVDFIEIARSTQIPSGKDWQ